MCFVVPHRSVWSDQNILCTYYEEDAFSSLILVYEKGLFWLWIISNEDMILLPYAYFPYSNYHQADYFCPDENPGGWSIALTELRLFRFSRFAIDQRFCEAVFFALSSPRLNSFWRKPGFLLPPALLLLLLLEEGAPSLVERELLLAFVMVWLSFSTCTQDIVLSLLFYLSLPGAWVNDDERMMAVRALAISN